MTYHHLGADADAADYPIRSAPSIVAAACRAAAIDRPAGGILVDGLFNEAAATIEALLKPAEPTIDNPTAWFYAADLDSEWWCAGGKTREETIAKGREAYAGQPFHVLEARRMVPKLTGVILADNVIDLIGDDECWGEYGFEGAGDTDELQRRLDATLERWFAEQCTLTCAQLDFVTGPERIAARSTMREKFR